VWTDSLVDEDRREVALDDCDLLTGFGAVFLDYLHGVAGDGHRLPVHVECYLAVEPLLLFDVFGVGSFERADDSTGAVTELTR
jgi:hypothetical protein